jgi:hypothetical protein
VCRVDEIAQVLPRPEPRIDVEEVLDTVAVIGLQIRPLPLHRPDPQGRNAKALQIVELALDALERPA